MMDSLDLPSLPQEVLSHIGSYLNPRDLLALSATCYYLRSVFNDNWLWKKYTDKGQLSCALENATSLSQPSFKVPSNTTLEPLCDHRLHFLKQSRLVQNLRRKDFLQYSIKFSSYLSDFESTKPLHGRQITYCGVYLFALGYDNKDDFEVINVYVIKQMPIFMTSIKLLQHVSDYSIVVKCQVVGDKLVVQQDNWFDVYEIKLLPPSFSLLHSFTVNGPVPYNLNQMVILGHYLFVENFTLNVINVWNINNGAKLDDIDSKIKGGLIRILGYSTNHGYILFSVSLVTEDKFKTSLFIYDIEVKQFKNFCVTVDIFKHIDYCYGLLDSTHVILLIEETKCTCSIYVFDYNTSVLIAQKNHLKCVDIDHTHIINGFLLLPYLTNVQILLLKNLETFCEAFPGPKNDDHEISSTGYIALECIKISNLCHLVVVRREVSAEVWDFECMCKLFDFPLNEFVFIDDSFSKLIVYGDECLSILNFW